MKKILEQETHCELSYELIHLLNWFIHNESATLKKMVQRAVEKKFNKSLSMHKDPALASDQVQYSIVELLELLEHFLQDALQKKQEEHASVYDFTKTIQKIDTQGYLSEVVKESFDKVVDVVDTEKADQAIPLFFKELLKNLRPCKKDAMH